MQVKPNFLKPRSYTPARYSTLITAAPAVLASPSMLREQKIIREEMIRIMNDYRDAVLAVATDLENSKLVSIRANKTGNQIDLKAKIGGLTLNLHLCTLESGSPNRTERNVMEELTLQVVDRLSPSGKIIGHGDQHFYSVIQEGLRVAIQSRLPERHLSVYHRDACLLLADSILERESARFGLRKFFEAFQNFVVNGEAEKNRNAHQSKRALAAVRQAAHHAFSHGVDIEEIVTAVRETLVKGVLES
jgi:hypothetical protein